jgi:hypothetical protein
MSDDGSEYSDKGGVDDYVLSKNNKYGGTNGLTKQ